MAYKVDVRQNKGQGMGWSKVKSWETRSRIHVHMSENPESKAEMVKSQDKYGSGLSKVGDKTWTNHGSKIGTR